MRSQPKNKIADVEYAINKYESLVLEKDMILHVNPSAIAKDFSTYRAVFRRHFHRICIFGAVRFSRVPAEAIWDVFAASGGESTVSVLLWKTLPRPIGVRVCLVVQFKFFQHRIRSA